MKAKKGFGNVGYKSPPDLALASRQVRAWIQALGVGEATRVCAEWMRVPAHPVPYFLLEYNVRDWIEWLTKNDIRLISAEFRCLWYSFEREVLPGLDSLLSAAGVEVDMPPPCGLLTKEESDALRVEQMPIEVAPPKLNPPEPEPIQEEPPQEPEAQEPPPQEPDPVAEGPQEAPEAQIGMFDMPEPPPEPEEPEKAPVEPNPETEDPEDEPIDLFDF